MLQAKKEGDQEPSLGAPSIELCHMNEIMSFLILFS